MKTIRVLLVDDHLSVREGTRLLLELDERITVAGEASTGEEALAKAERCPVDVVLVDIMMPGMDGIEVTRRLRAKHPQVKVVVFSAFGDEYLRESLEAGAHGYILKTATQPELVQAVVQAASGYNPIDPRLTSKLLGQMSQLRGSGRQELSKRQREVLRLIADGVPTRVIKQELSISRATLSRELRHVYDVLGVNDRAHAVAEAYRRKLLRPVA